jgi:hypothetical protein
LPVARRCDHHLRAPASIAGGDRVDRDQPAVDWHSRAEPGRRDDDAVAPDLEPSQRHAFGDRDRQRRQLRFELLHLAPRRRLAIATGLELRAGGDVGVLAPGARELALTLVADRQGEQRPGRRIEPEALGKLGTRSRIVVMREEVAAVSKENLRKDDVARVGECRPGQSKKGGKRERKARRAPKVAGAPEAHAHLRSSMRLSIASPGLAADPGDGAV